MERCQKSEGGFRADPSTRIYRVARRDQVGLHDPRVPHRPTRAVRRDHVVGSRRGALRVQRADGQRRRRVAGRLDAAVADRLRRRIGAEVAGGDDDDDAGADGDLDGLHERVGLGGFVDRVAEREVDDVDAQRRAWPPRTRAQDDVAGVAAAGGVEDLHVNETDARGHAAVGAREAGLAAARNEAGDVGAVAELVGVRRPSCRCEVVALLTWRFWSCVIPESITATPTS